ncbi:hypothetical protein [Streptomyces sp. NPDC048643]|uniref:hypothetical protein n=1 Tax=Streptomyces sp. NPDC048643 TaxID=3155637 RepID=UPI0034364389
MPSEIKAPRVTASQRRAERTAERVDAWKIARNLIGPEAAWPDGVDPYDVFQLAQWLAGDATE